MPRINHVVEEEGIDIDQAGMDLLLKMAEGDMRRRVFQIFISFFAILTRADKVTNLLIALFWRKMTLSAAKLKTKRSVASKIKFEIFEREDSLLVFSFATTQSHFSRK